MGCGSSVSASVKSSTAGTTTAAAANKSLKLDFILCTPSDVRSMYTFDKVLGKGNFGVVHLVYNKTTGEALACKSISKRKLLTHEDVEDVKREVQIMNHLAGHPNVTNLRGTFEDKTFIHLLMDVCTGGELFDRIAERGHFSEKTAAESMRTIVGVVHHCHQMNVIHRDLKPENFLLATKDAGALLKATDFGLSRFFKDGERLNEIVGSPFYVAPEVLKRNYSREADIWSCGVILYILLCGWPPFHGDSTQAIFKNILAAPLDLKSNPWPKISDAAKDCVRKMLTRDPKRRLTVEQVMDHPWMRVNGVATDEPFLPEVLTRMRHFAKMNKLKKEALKIMARALPTNEIMGIREMFEEIDQDGSGCITVDELREGLRKKGANLAFQEVQKIVDSIDINGNSKIDYEEFLASTVHLNKLNREENMIAAFRYFDSDNSGFISRAELEDAMKKIGETDVDVEEILQDADGNGDGMIDYEEFCKMMRNNDFDALRCATLALKTKIVVQPKMTQSFTAKVTAPYLDSSSTVTTPAGSFNRGDAMGSSQPASEDSSLAQLPTWPGGTGVTQPTLRSPLARVARDGAAATVRFDEPQLSAPYVASAVAATDAARDEVRGDLQHSEKPQAAVGHVVFAGALDVLTGPAQPSVAAEQTP